MRFRIFFVGIVMGIADLIPGISGGSVAFFSGHYTTFLSSFRNLFKDFFLPFLRGHWKQAFKSESFVFLSPLLLGILVSVFSFSRLLYWGVSDPIYQVYFYAFCLGLILCSSFDAGREVKNWGLSSLAFLLIGVVSAFALSKMEPSSVKEIQGLSWQIIMIGFFATTAMLLPGISGSYILLIFGYYTPLVFALSHPFEWSSWIFLINLCLGIILGFLLSSRLVLWCIRNYPSLSFSWLLGAVVGSVWCFFPNFKNSSENWFGQLFTVFLGIFVFYLFKKIAYKDQIFL